MVGWHHQLNGHKFEQTLGDSGGQRSLACCSPCSCKELDTIQRLNNEQQYTYHIIFIHSSVDGHLGCSQVLVIVNSAAMNMGCMCLFKLQFSPYICPGMGLLGHMVTLFLVSKETTHHFPQWLHQFTPPLTVQEGSFFSMHCPAFVICRLIFNDDN